MKKITAFSAALLICAVLLCMSVSASYKAVFVVDDANVISDADEQLIMKEAKRVAEKTGFNIVVTTADDIGSPKTDAHVVEYADDKYEELCGIDTDGILLLINCDTKYDYISTSGSCINYFSDARIDSIFDDIYDDLVAEKFGKAAHTFVLSVEKFYDRGKANHQMELAGGEFDPDEFFSTLGMLIIFGLFIGIFIYFMFAAGFKTEKPQTRQYVLDNSLAFDKRNDIYIGTNVNRIYTPRSSSSGGHSSGGHHSSTHHSSSGGRHGGGGRHR